MYKWWGVSKFPLYTVYQLVPDPQVHCFYLPHIILLQGIQSISEECYSVAS